jgi:large subunit ribosomal protein L9
MKVILREDVKKIGKAGDLVSVSDGYARNYLFPRGLAVEATTGELKTLNVKKEKEESKQRRQEDKAKNAADKLTDAIVKIKVKVGEGGRLYGSVTNKDIADAIKRETGFNIDKRKIELKEQVKTLGEFTADVRLHQDITAQIRFEVVE